MFWDVYTRLCAKDGKAPNVIAREVCGVKSTGTVTGWKNGATPRNNVLGQLSEYFGVSIDYLLTGEEQKEKPTPSEESELNAHAKAILYKYEQLNPAQRVMFEKMLDAALEAAKGDKNEKG